MPIRKKLRRKRLRWRIRLSVRQNAKQRFHVKRLAPKAGIRPRMATRPRLTYLKEQRIVIAINATTD